MTSRVPLPGLSWALGVVLPWCLGAGMLVSATADAGQDFLQGATISPLAVRAAAIPDDLVPRLNVAGAFGPIGGGRGLLREARLAIGPAEALRAVTDEITPRPSLKPNARQFPLVDRARRGDPAIGLRPSFDAKLRGPGGYGRFMASDLAFRHDEMSPASSFAPVDGEADGPDSVATFEPWADGDAPATTGPAGGGAVTPGGSTSVVTIRPASLSARLAQGATPAVPRAVALGSATPAPVDATPAEVLATAGRGYEGRRPESSVATRSAERPIYASLVGTDARERKCLAEVVYFEARSEPEDGQAAVAQVVLNRVTSGLYPASICGVVYQNRARYKACQFSFACEGKSLRVTDEASWTAATRVADAVLEGRTYLAEVGRATHYHATYVRPAWSRYLKRMDAIGHHIFYSMRTARPG